MKGRSLLATDVKQGQLPVGTTGPAGPQGETGAVGAQGAVGAMGEIGVRGERGEVGSTASTGAKGETGPGGRAGERGPQGPVGALGSYGVGGLGEGVRPGQYSSVDAPCSGPGTAPTSGGVIVRQFGVPIGELPLIACGPAATDAAPRARRVWRRAIP